MTLYLLLAIALLIIGLHGLFVRAQLMRKILALNVLTTAVFLLLVALAHAAEVLDPVPHAMVLTGIVVTVSTTAVALGLMVRLLERRGGPANGHHGRDSRDP
ncbi:NADH-quinone oxidoreductase subunit K [Thioalkalivibrio sp. AKL17]|uniref:NADH-quinone oxidoreductase subunit K n=1 Tax=Thioalkalivibrio sp. AKL17 TaxID=1158160 RepID=UPI00037629A4|nr:NADH-quinone oxidoreductase subunit K [Thioalkalivibrio sp. AKL17]